MRSFDALVVGAGPAGVAAALYLARFSVRVALVEKLAPGGLLLQTFEIENYPGFPKGVKGYELADALSEQLEPYANLTRIYGEIAEMRIDGPIKSLRIDDEWIEARAIVICSGVRYRKLGLPGEDQLLGKGLSHCALCDGNFFRDQVVGVAGGGNSAIEESLHLAKIASKLHIIHRRDEFRAAPVYVSRLDALPNVVMEYSTVITALHGEDKLEGVTLKRLKNDEEQFLPLDGLFIFIGFVPAAQFLPAELERDNGGFILTDTEMRTNIPGIFAAGDIRSKLCRQVVTAVGDGATAANTAHIYLEQSHG
ncbi:FAD-dependent oxidoreductase [Desulfovibrio sp. OttesenSCG-928-F20]|nr:FAD-dependent oxidoreductase [Desulfovibrio sp. OttesenSCG-928-M16]MDL2290584.1 FAD-dependent oxidoreductase [Desulfovibrio sp. OttesenSCG-928-F20]